MCLGPPRVTRTPRDTYLAELTPDTGLSHWLALPLVIQRSPRLGGDRLGCFYGRLGGLLVGVSLLWQSRLALSPGTLRRPEESVVLVETSPALAPDLSNSLRQIRS